MIPGTTETPGADLESAEIESFASLMVGFLIVSALVSVITQRLRIPYTIGLVLVGLALSIFGQSLIKPLSPEIILVVLLPPLLFEAVIRTNVIELRRAIVPVMILTVPGVVLTTLLVGGVLAIGADVPLPFALVFGALIAPTDPVAVMALFRSIGAPNRLMSVFEGESLLNDGTAIVLFKLMLTIAITGQVNISGAFLQFLVIAGGGLLVGAAVGALTALLLNRLNHYIVETTVSIALAYGAYLIGEFFFGVSGVLAVVGAGLMVTSLSQQKLSPTTRIFVSNFWEYAAFIANSFIFLIIGMQTKVQQLLDNAVWIFWSILAVLLARLLVVMVVRFARWRQKWVPISWNVVLFWGGLRGAVSLALALSLSYELPYREQIQAMAFGVVLFSLLVQGSTISWLVNRLGLATTSRPRIEYETRHARLTGLRAASNRLHAMYRQGLISKYAVETLVPLIDERIEKETVEEKSALENEPAVRREALTDAWYEALRAQRSAINGLYSNNMISEEVYYQVVTEIDGMLQDTELSWPEIRESLHLMDDLENGPARNGQAKIF